jgi:PAS domain S-box-containing protein
LDGSVQIEQALKQEIQALQARVFHLEKVISAHDQHATSTGQLAYFDPPLIEPATVSAPLLGEESAHTSSLLASDVSILLSETPLWTLDAVFETIIDGLAVYDVQGNIVRANAAFRRMIGIEALAQPLQKRADTVGLHNENGEPYTLDELPITRLLAGETLANETIARVTFLNPAGHKISADVSGAPIRDAQDAIIGVVTVFRDVTERRKQEQALFDANQRMDEFLSIASHELRTPLTTINGNIQLAKRRVQSLATQILSAFRPDSPGQMQEVTGKFSLIQELLYRAERQVHIQNRLVNELLDVSRIQSNRLELHMLPCDLVSIVREVVEDQRTAHPDRTITFAHFPANVTIPVYADADRIAQVITNFLTNALKYSTSDQPVELSISYDDAQVRVSVRDHGTGIPEQEQAHLWERFYRVPGIVVQSGSGVGLGLGLYICRTIVDNHNGQIGVQSTPSVGSTFWFSLPISR